MKLFIKKNFMIPSACWLIVITACSPAPQSATHHENMEIIGRLDRATLQNFNWFQRGYENYTPDQATVDYLQRNAGEIGIEAFIGTWCPDSQREFPKLIKAADEAGITNIVVIGVPGGAGILDVHAIERQIKGVPTFIFLHDEREIGRVERDFSRGPEYYMRRIYGSVLGNDAMEEMENPLPADTTFHRDSTTPDTLLHNE